MKKTKQIKSKNIKEETKPLNFTELVVLHDVGVGMKINVDVIDNFPIITMTTFKDIGADSYKCSKNLQKEFQDIAENFESIKKEFKKLKLYEK